MKKIINIFLFCVAQLTCISIANADIQLSKKDFATASHEAAGIQFDVSKSKGNYLDITFPVERQSVYGIAIKEYAGFECDLVSLRKERNKTLYRLLIDWSPGSDLSGCHLEITIGFRGEESKASVELYMNYGNPDIFLAY